MKKLIALFIVCTMLVSVLPLVCAADEPAQLQNLKISKYGIITWDPFEGGTNCWLDIDNGSTPFTNGHSVLEDRGELSVGEHTFTIDAYDDNGEKHLAAGTLFVYYDGKEFTVLEKLSETEETEPETEPEDTTDYGDGVIKNVRISDVGVISWDEYELADQYWLGVDGGYLPTENNADLKERVTEPGEHRIKLEAYAGEGEKWIAEWSGEIVYEDGKFRLVDSSTPIVTETETEQTGTAGDPAQSGNVTDPAQTDGAAQTTEGTAPGPSGSNRTAVIVCAVIGVLLVAAAVAAAVVIVIVRSKKKTEHA